jgi:putative hydrolase of the HAD superfamily
VVLAPATREALGRARIGGWTCAIVTNGRTAQQEAKIRRTGLDRLVRGWVVSEAVGHKKPEPEIFHAAAATAGLPLPGAWVVGDAPHADIAGADALGLRSVWLAHGRAWTEIAYRPTHIAADIAAAIHHVIGTTHRSADAAL